MFANVAVALSTLAIFAAASGPTRISQCNTGTLQCCSQVFAPHSEEAGKHADVLAGIDLTNVVGNIGFQCNPITLVNVAGGANCGQAPVCCQANQLNGAINLGCVGVAA